MENDPITLNIALDSERKASGKLYFDDQITHDYQKGEFSYKQVSFDGKTLNYRYVNKKILLKWNSNIGVLL